jgi:transcriptional regulator with XRE-family HTH domain
MTDLKTRRLQAKLSQRELARKTGLAQALLSRFERGERAPNAAQAALLNQVLGPDDSASDSPPRESRAPLNQPRLDPYPSAPTDPIARRQFMDRRNAAIRDLGKEVSER